MSTPSLNLHLNDAAEISTENSVINQQDTSEKGDCREFKSTNGSKTKSIDNRDIQFNESLMADSDFKSPADKIITTAFADGLEPMSSEGDLIQIDHPEDPSHGTRENRFSKISPSDDTVTKSPNGKSIQGKFFGDVDFGSSTVELFTTASVGDLKHKSSENDYLHTEINENSGCSPPEFNLRTIELVHTESKSPSKTTTKEEKHCRPTEGKSVYIELLDDMGITLKEVSVDTSQNRPQRNFENFPRGDGCPSSPEAGPEAGSSMKCNYPDNSPLPEDDYGPRTNLTYFADISDTSDSTDTSLRIQRKTKKKQQEISESENESPQKNAPRKSALFFSLENRTSTMEDDSTTTDDIRVTPFENIVLEKKKQLVSNKNPENSNKGRDSAYFEIFDDEFRNNEFEKSTSPDNASLGSISDSTETAEDDFQIKDSDSTETTEVDFPIKDFDSTEMVVDALPIKVSDSTETTEDDFPINDFDSTEMVVDDLPIKGSDSTETTEDDFPIKDFESTETSDDELPTNSSGRRNSEYGSTTDISKEPGIVERESVANNSKNPQKIEVKLRNCKRYSESDSHVLEGDRKRKLSVIYEESDDSEKSCKQSRVEKED